MFNRLFPSTFGRKKLAKFAKNIAQGKNVTQIFGNRWESSNMQATVLRYQNLAFDPKNLVVPKFPGGNFFFQLSRSREV